MLKHTLLATLRRIVLPVVMALVPLTVFAQQIDMSLDKVTVRRAMEYLQREYGYSISVRSDERLTRFSRDRMSIIPLTGNLSR